MVSYFLWSYKFLSASNWRQIIVRTKQLEEIYRVIDKINSDKKAEIIEESKEWVSLAQEKTNEELFTITDEKRTEYNPAFIIAAELEIKKEVTYCNYLQPSLYHSQLLSTPKSQALL